MREQERPINLSITYPAHLVPQIEANGGIEHEVKEYEAMYGRPLEARVLKDGRLHIRELFSERISRTK